MDFVFKFIFGLCLFTFAESVPQLKAECYTNCSPKYEPVCGEDKTGELTTFTNRCWYDLRDCQNSESRWQLINENGECEYAKPVDTDIECKKNYEHCNVVIFKPLCGRNIYGKQKQFKNMCIFKRRQCLSHRNEKWKIIKSGSCVGKVEIPPRKYHCPTNCSKKIDPVCGKLSETGETRVFMNQCHFDRILCNNSNWDIVNNTECSILAYDFNEINPMCGITKDGKMQSFINHASFKLHNYFDHSNSWKFLNDGICPDPVEKITCRNRCTKVFRPVCGQDADGNLKTFPNKCSLDYTACTNPLLNWTYLKKGSCIGAKNHFVKKRKTSEFPLSCFGVCNMHYAPFCAISSAGQIRTFTNQCEHDFETCNNRDCVWKKLNNGPCPEDKSAVILL